MLRFLFPNSMLKPRCPDEMFEEQVGAFQAAGFETSLISLEALQRGQAKITPSLNQTDIVVYRGWMLTAEEYSKLYTAITSSGAMPLTSTQDYLSTHHLPNWYPLIKDFTPETQVFPPDTDLELVLKALGWHKFFIKDYVKSVKTSIGSVIDTPEKAALVVSEMEKYRGLIEGGFCVRRVEDFLPETERRYFVIDQCPYSADLQQEIPPIVTEVAQRIPSRFFSVDLIRRSDGVLRVVEVGDGQVSDIVGWTAHRLAAIWAGRTS